MNARGTTLLELLVAMMVMAVALGVATVAFRPDPAPDASARIDWQIATARQRALSSRHVVRFTIVLDSGSVEGAAYPDGRVLLADPSLTPPMSGRRHAE